jgi:ribonuclease BN (tRNA processing enzyme)
MMQISPALMNTGTRVITLGTLAGPAPKAHRAQSSNLLIANDTLYVIDTGDGVTRRLAKARINIPEIGTIFLTHHHADHTAGLGTLMSIAWMQGRTAPINVYGPPGTQQLVDAAVQFFTLSSEIRIAERGRMAYIAEVFSGHDVSTGVVYQDSNIKVTAAENSHFVLLEGSASQKYKSYSYRFETPDRVIVFTGDTGPIESVTELAKGADLFIAEANSMDDRKQAMINDGSWQTMSEHDRVRVLAKAAQGHLSPEAVGRMATRANVKTVVLTHLTYRPPPNTENYEPWADEVRAHFSGKVLIANDLMEF